MRTKIRKHNRAYKGNYKGTIDVHKHTKVRRRRSHWNVYTNYFLATGKPTDPAYENGSCYPTEPLVQDISIGLQNPLDPTQSVYNIQYMNRLVDRQLEVKSLPERMAEDMTQIQYKVCQDYGCAR